MLEKMVEFWFCAIESFDESPLFSFQAISTPLHLHIISNIDFVVCLYDIWIGS
jgi:hypothetical protein